MQAQWSSSGNDISNTNTGNVGIGTGTTAPGYKLNVSNADDKSQIRFGLGAFDSGGFLFSNGPTHAVFSGGASWNGAWFAKGMNASSIQLNTGTISFFANSGLTANSQFTPTARMSITASGNVGIGGNPTSKLHLISGTDSGTTLLSLDTGVHGGTSMAVFGTANNESGFDMSVYRAGVYTSRFGVNSAGNVYLQPGGGNVGVGTSTPDSLAKLHVYGSGGFGQEIQTTTADWTRLRFVTPNRTWGFFLDGGTGGLGSGKFGLYDYTASLWRMVFDTAGNVGVGTTGPGYRLDVQGGQVNASGGLCIAGDCKTAWSEVGGGSSQWTTAGSAIYYGTGNVGIGLTSAPTRKLQVLGGNVFHQWSTTAGSEYGFYTSIHNNHLASNIYFDGQWKMITAGKGASIAIAPFGAQAFAVYGDNTSRAANATAALSQLFAVMMDGKVGIGIASPSYSLDVNGGVNGFRAKASTTSSTDSVAAFENSSGVQMIVRGNGNVGIGTTSPANKLHVAGSITVDGNINAKYQDVAEWVETSQPLLPGTVVVLDGARSNQVIASTQSYDTRVAGVISARPGIALGEKGDDKVLVATTGRVRIKVSAQNGPIAIGDLLVTSDQAGVAMKSIAVEVAGVRLHRPGTLIGKALEPLAQGSGEILVLLSLQ